jgi:hypothetical protein
MLEGAGGDWWGERILFVAECLYFFPFAEKIILVLLFYTVVSLYLSIPSGPSRSICPSLLQGSTNRIPDLRILPYGILY